MTPFLVGMLTSFPISLHYPSCFCSISFRLGLVSLQNMHRDNRQGLVMEIEDAIFPQLKSVTVSAYQGESLSQEAREALLSLDVLVLSPCVSGHVSALESSQVLPSPLPLSPSLPTSLQPHTMYHFWFFSSLTHSCHSCHSSLLCAAFRHD